MTDGDHNIDVVVTSASETNQFIVDYFSILPGAGGSNTSNNSPSSTETSSGSPTAATHSTPVGPIAGAVIGAVVLLVIALWYLRKRRSHTYNKPGLGGTLPDEGSCIFHRLMSKNMLRVYPRSSSSNQTIEPCHLARSRRPGFSVCSLETHYHRLIYNGDKEWKNNYCRYSGSSRRRTAYTGRGRQSNFGRGWGTRT